MLGRIAVRGLATVPAAEDAVKKIFLQKLKELSKKAPAGQV